MVSLNHLMLFTYKETSSGADKTRTFFQVFEVKMENIWFFLIRRRAIGRHERGFAA